MLPTVRSDDGGHRLVEAEQHSLALAAPSAAARARLCPATNGSVSVHSSQNIPSRCFAGASRRARSHGPDTPAESSPRAFQRKHFAKDFGVRSLPPPCPCLSSDHGSTAHRSCPGLGEDIGVPRPREMLPRSAGRSRRRSDSPLRQNAPRACDGEPAPPTRTRPETWPWARQRNLSIPVPSHDFPEKPSTSGKVTSGAWASAEKRCAPRCRFPASEIHRECAEHPTGDWLPPSGPPVVLARTEFPSLPAEGPTGPGKEVS